jgi:hypothetical protein
VRIGRHDPPGDHVGAVGKPGRHVECGRVRIAGRMPGLADPHRVPGRVEQLDRLRNERHRLVEPQRHLPRLAAKDRAVYR